MIVTSYMEIKPEYLPKFDVSHEPHLFIDVGILGFSFKSSETCDPSGLSESNLVPNVGSNIFHDLYMN